MWPPFPQALLQPDGRTATLELEPTPIVGTSTGKPICKLMHGRAAGDTLIVYHTQQTYSTPETGRHWRWTPELLASGPGQSLASVVSLAVGSSSCCDVTTPCRITFHLGIHKCFPSSQAFTSRRPQGLIPRAFLYVGNCICWTFCYSKYGVPWHMGLPAETAGSTKTRRRARPDDFTGGAPKTREMDRDGCAS